MYVVTNKENTSAETKIKICEMKSNPSRSFLLLCMSNTWTAALILNDIISGNSGELAFWALTPSQRLSTQEPIR